MDGVCDQEVCTAMGDVGADAVGVVGGNAPSLSEKLCDAACHLLLLIRNLRMLRCERTEFGHARHNAACTSTNYKEQCAKRLNNENTMDNSVQ